MFKEKGTKCPACLQPELRPVLLGNDKDGWEDTGSFICDSCRYEEIGDEEKIPQEHLDNCSGCSLCEPQDNYREYKDEEINALNNND